MYVACMHIASQTTHFSKRNLTRSLFVFWPLHAQCKIVSFLLLRTLKPEMCTLTTPVYNFVRWDYSYSTCLLANIAVYVSILTYTALSKSLLLLCYIFTTKKVSNHMNRGLIALNFCRSPFNFMNFTNFPQFTKLFQQTVLKCRHVHTFHVETAGVSMNNIPGLSYRIYKRFSPKR